MTKKCLMEAGKVYLFSPDNYVEGPFSSAKEAAACALQEELVVVAMRPDTVLNGKDKKTHPKITLDINKKLIIVDTDGEDTVLAASKLYKTGEYPLEETTPEYVNKFMNAPAKVVVVGIPIPSGDCLDQYLN